MEQETIIEGNKLIAEFLGAKWWPKSRNLFVKYSYAYEFKGFAINPERLRFHSSWDYLMIAVDKVEACTNNYKPDGLRFQVDISSEYIHGIKNKNIDYLYSCTIVQNQYPRVRIINNSKITATWIAVIEFIKWYKTKTNNNE